MLSLFISLTVNGKKQPNLIVYMIDDLGWNQISAKQATMGTHTGSFITPNIEKIANHGLSFTHAYTQPNCAPSRAAMLSGQYPARINNGVYVVNSLNRNKKPGITKEQAQFKGPNQRQDVAGEAVTIAEALKKNGYNTAHIGKYHVGGHSGESTMPENQGFDINIGGYTQGHQPTCFAKNGKDGWQFTKLGRGDFDRFGKPYSESYVKKYGIPKSQVGKPKHVCDALADAMEETVQSLAAKPEPFYLQLHAYAVHGPVQSRPDLKEAAIKHLEAKNSKQANLAGFIAGMDAVLGRLLNSLKDPDRNGDKSDSIANDTLILFTSDNGGTHFDNLPLRGVKGMFTEGGIRIPLIAYWPGVIPENSITDRMVHGIDFYPTLLELAGNSWLPPPKNTRWMESRLPSSCSIPKAKENVHPSFTCSPVTWMSVHSPALSQSMKSMVKGINYSISMKLMNGSSTTSPTTSGRKRILPKICQMSLPAYQRKFRPGFLKNIRPGSQNTLSVKKAALQSSHASYDLLQITR